MVESVVMPMGEGSSSGRFHTTRWSVVLAAGKNPSSPEAKEALASLAQAYWFPIYSFVRRQGHSPQDAEDLTQEFISRLIEKQYLADVSPEKGRFRSFLLACLRHFLSNEYDRVKALKRGGGRKTIAFDGMDAEARYQLEPASHLTPERLFDRRWAIEVLNRTLLHLQREYVESGRAEVFEALKHLLQADGDGLAYAQIGERLKMSEGAVKVAVTRLRARYRKLLREEVFQTVASDEELRSELQDLLSCL